MLIGRGTLLARLNEAQAGLSTKEKIEQSNCFVFRGERLVTFNDSIMVRVPNPLDFDAVVNATDMLGILAKIPDDEVEVTFNGSELRIKGKRRTAGIAATAEVALAIDAAPSPEKWKRLAEGVVGALQQAARTCSDDDSTYLTTVVHVGPDRIEACDNFRLYRVDGPTGFPSDVLLPGSAVAELDGMELAKVAAGAGWWHFKTGSGAEISLRCSHDPYHEDVDKLLVMGKGAEKLVLPSNLGEMIERAEVFNTGGHDAKIGIKIVEGELVLTSRKDGGWYKERKRISYTGRPLEFEINPDFLVEILNRTREVEVDDAKIKITAGSVQFVVYLVSKSDDAAEEK